MRCKSVPALLAVLASAAVACGADDGGGAGPPATTSGSRPAVVVTTSILGDVVANLVGERASVEVVMPPGASPHDFEASARQAAAMRKADALVVNGGGFEEGLADVIDAARDDGVATYEAISSVQTLPLPERAGHGDEPARDGEDAHQEKTAHAGDQSGDVDPHFFTDPRRMAAAARGVLDFLIEEVPAFGGDGAHALRAGAAEYLSQLEEVDREAEQALSVVPPERRKLVTNHEVFGYFADRYGFEVLGAVIPGGATQAAPSPAALADLAQLVRRAQVRAVFADTSSPEELSAALAAEVGDVEVVELYSESLGPPGSPGATYLDLVRTNASRIAAALAG